MLLAIDIGNSSISVGVFDILAVQAPVLLSHFKITAKELSADEFTVLLKDFLARDAIYPVSASNVPARTVDASVISSVVPKLTNTLVRTAYNLCGKTPFLITSGIHTGFGIQIKNPEQLGTDIVCNSAAALRIASAPLVILDMGTATTITYIDKNLTIQGSVISPGLKISLDALYDSAAQIGDIMFEEKPSLVGKDTRTAVCSGAINGNAFMIDGFVRSIRETYLQKDISEKLSLVATGGLAPVVLPYLRNKFTYIETLTLQGMANLYLKNHKTV